MFRQEWQELVNTHQGRIHVWYESALAPLLKRNHANSAYFRLFLGYFQVISATQPPPPPFGSCPPPFLHILDLPLQIIIISPVSMLQCSGDATGVGVEKTRRANVRKRQMHFEIICNF